MTTINDLLKSGEGILEKLVLYRMNDRIYARTKPANYSDRKSPAQLAQRQRLQVVNRFLRPFSAVIRMTFAGQAEGRTALQAAQSYIMRHALAGEYPNIYVDKSKALLSMGSLPLPAEAWIEAGPEGLLIRWNNGEEARGSAARDTLVVMALSENSDRSEYKFTGVSRSAGEYLWSPALQAREDAPLDVWIAFRNEMLPEMSNSLHVATIAQ